MDSEKDLEELAELIAEDEPKEPQEDKPPRRDLFEWAQAMVFSIIFIVLLFATAIRIIGVDGDSMMQTLLDGDRVAITNLFYTPDNGDVVVLRKEGFMHEPIVKRVIAVSGQTIDIDFKNHIVYVDGVAIDEPYINEPTSRKENLDFPLTVPEGHIFVMGDNRQRSLDSRNSALGMVDTRCVIGRVVFRVFPFSKIGTIE